MEYFDHIKGNIRAKAWKGYDAPPKKILVMRFQALGDTVITLPYLQNLKRQYPQVELHFLTREEVSPIPKSIVLFDRVITFGGGRSAKRQFLSCLLRVPWLLSQQYDAVLDLQNNKISRIIRKFLFTKAWTEFDVDIKTTLSAGERTRQTIGALWRWKIGFDPEFNFHTDVDAAALLKRNGWRPDNSLVALNPAGSFPSRNWPAECYVNFAKLWLDQVNDNTQFVLLLLPALKEKADYIAKELGDRCINLTGKSSQVEAFAILQRCSFALSEDGGMMHMAWIQKVPTLALFSSTKKEWSAPQGEWSQCLDAADIECGPCTFVVCKFGDNRCLTRYTPEFVIARAKELLNTIK